MSTSGELAQTMAGLGPNLAGFSGHVWSIFWDTILVGILRGRQAKFEAPPILCRSRAAKSVKHRSVSAQIGVCQPTSS